MTKFIPILACVCACACASTTVVHPTVSMPETPQQETIAIETSGELSVAALEERIYQISIDRIDQKMQEEALQIVNGQKTFKQACEIDMLVDSRGGHHHKPYCR